MKKKLFSFIVLTLIFFSCEKEDSNLILNNNSIEKHFVKIEKIKSIVAKQKFNEFLSNLQSNELRKSSNLNTKLTVIDIKEYKDKNKVTAFYMTKLSNSKFVLFAADDRSHTVMGITDIAYPNATINSIPTEFQYWLDEEINAIEFARDNNLAQTDEVVKEWESYLTQPPADPTICNAEYHINKWPLLSTFWHQGYGYNDFTPHLGCSNYSNGNAPTGCVATATAQIMKYHQWPSTYNWNAMPNDYGTSATSQLMVDIGNNVSMDYGCDGSGTKSYNAMYALTGAFGYSNALYGNYDYNTVLSELQQDKPVLLAGGEKKYWAGLIPYYAEGHAWVADGFMQGFTCSYDENGYVNGGYGYVLFHMNWGWGEGYNMYCGLNDFSVNGNSYNYQRKMIYGIRK